MVRGRLTQTEFARKLGIPHQNSVSRYEAGRPPPHELLLRIAEIGGVGLDWLLTGRVPESVPTVRERPERYGRMTLEDRILEQIQKLTPSQKKRLLSYLDRMTKP
jgi:transcriptional regulator with XRE-family HTH domain